MLSLYILNTAYRLGKLQMKLVIVLAMLFFSATAYSVGEARYFFVDHVRVDKSGKGYIKFKNKLLSSGGLPTCASGHPYHLAFDTRTDGGKAILSSGLAAKASHQKMWALGNNKCDVYSSVESWDWGYGL